MALGCCGHACCPMHVCMHAWATPIHFPAPHSLCRSQKDADLLYEAKYGKRGEDGKMTREQYQ